MNQIYIAVIAAAAMTAWTGSVFIDVIDGDVLWKKLGSGASFLVFTTILIMVLRKWIRVRKDSASSQ